MQILTFDKFFEEVELNLAELDKVKIEDGKLRGDTLVRKIKSGEEFTLKSGKKAKIDKMKSAGQLVPSQLGIQNITTNGDYNSEKAKKYFKPKTTYEPVLHSDKEGDITLNQIKKTEEFGSKGAGKNVIEFESIQCIFLGIRQMFPTVNITRHNRESFLKQYLKSGQNRVHLKDNIKINQEIVNKFTKNDDWTATFVKIPNRLWNGGYINRNIIYDIYHTASSKSDSPYKVISEKYRSIAKDDKFSDINFSKFCPADVVLINSVTKNEIINEIKSKKNITELVEVLNKHFDSGNLISISLKKIEGNFKIIQNSEKEKEMPNFYISNFHFGSDFKGIGSKISTYSIWKYKDSEKNVDTKDRKINFDSSDTGKKINIDGEVEGSASRHGKISFEALKRIIKTSGMEFNLEEYKDLAKLTKPELNVKLKELINKSISLSKLPMIDVRPITRGTDTRTSENRMISRIQSLQVTQAILDISLKDTNLANDIITKIMRYALSIQTDKFDTPRYFRVI